MSGATVAALRGLGKKTILILGGDRKGQDFSPLHRPSCICSAAACVAHRRASRTALNEADRLKPGENPGLARAPGSDRFLPQAAQRGDRGADIWCLSNRYHIDAISLARAPFFAGGARAMETAQSFGEP